jgi:5-methylcytosine-specific restriction protein A
MPKPMDQRARPRERRGSARERGYTSRWDKARKTYLTSHPLCCYCEREGRIEPATVVDHIIPHKGDQALFWDAENNWQPLCAPCHSSVKQREEQGTLRTIGCDGWPIE